MHWPTGHNDRGENTYSIAKVYTTNKTSIMPSVPDLSLIKKKENVNKQIRPIT